MSVDLAVVARYVRSVNGQIRVTSELGRGTIFTVELPFEHASSSDVAKPRKLRSLFLLSLGSPNGRPPSSISPAMKTQPSDRGRSSRSRQYDQALGFNSQTGEATSPDPNMNSGGQASLVNLNMLVAEANPSTLRMLDERLSQWDHNVDIASNGQECHERFVSDPSKVDIILMSLEV